MSEIPTINELDDLVGAAGTGGPHFSIEVGAAELPAWTEVEPGRFMPRRVRGSYQGRALG